MGRGRGFRAPVRRVVDRRRHRVSPRRRLHDAGRQLAGRGTVRRPAHILRRPVPADPRSHRRGPGRHLRHGRQHRLVGHRGPLGDPVLVAWHPRVARPQASCRRACLARDDRGAVHKSRAALGRQPARVGAERVSALPPGRGADARRRHGRERPCPVVPLAGPRHRSGHRRDRRGPPADRARCGVAGRGRRRRDRRRTARSHPAARGGGCRGSSRSSSARGGGSRVSPRRSSPASSSSAASPVRPHCAWSPGTP